MAKKPTGSSPKATPAPTTPAAVNPPVPKAPKADQGVETPVRQTTVPKGATVIVTTHTAPPAKAGVTITDAMIAERAYYLAHSGADGSPDDHWHRAERELRAELG